MAFFDTDQSTFDPYAQDRMQHMDMLKQSQADYSAGMNAPLGFLDPEMQRFLESKTREQVRSANPKAGGSGWLADREASEMLKLRMALLDKNLQESNNQRQTMVQLAGQQMPTQQVPGETGMLSTAGAGLMGHAVGGMGAGLGDYLSKTLFGQKEKNPSQSRPSSPYAPWTPGSFNVNQPGTTFEMYGR